MPGSDSSPPPASCAAARLRRPARRRANFGQPGAFDIGPLDDWVRSVDASYDGAWELPVLGAVEPPGAVLVRPDGYVAWVGGPDAAGLTDALTRWFGCLSRHRVVIAIDA